MEVDWRKSTGKQFGAAIDMQGDMILLCPGHLWTVLGYTDPDAVGRFAKFEKGSSLVLTV
jgi:hypothetical protein